VQGNWEVGWRKALETTKYNLKKSLRIVNRRVVDHVPVSQAVDGRTQTSCHLCWSRWSQPRGLHAGVVVGWLQHVKSQPAGQNGTQPSRAGFSLFVLRPD